MIRGIFSRLSRLFRRFAPRQGRNKLLTLDLSSLGTEPGAWPSVKEAGPGPGTEAESRISATPDLTDVIIGLDFGTSCTKVVVRTPYIEHGWAVAVSFGEAAHGRSPYILPSSLTFKEGGLAVLRPPVGEGASWQDGLKMRLIDRRGDPEVEAEVVAFLALVIKYTRGWFLGDYSGILRSRAPRWRLNIGIPSTGYDDAALKSAFERVSAAAWVAASMGAPIRLEICSRIRSEPAALTERLTDIDVVPEVVAEAVGYARSPQRRPGLHLLLDIGASTLDVCALVFHRDGGEDKYALLEREVKRLGTLELHRARIEAVGGRTSCTEAIRRLDLLDPFCVIPDRPAAYLAAGHPFRAALEQADRKFKEDCMRPVRSCLVPARMRRDPRSPNWREGLPVFLCGGGANMNYYLEVVRSVSNELKGSGGVSEFDVQPLPRPFTLSNTDVTENIYQRLAVAYGLGFENFERGEIYPRHEVDDIPPLPRRPPRDFISKEQV